MPRAINVSNVMLVCPKCGKKTRVAHVLGEDGKYLRSCKECGAVIDAKEEKKQTKIIIIKDIFLNGDLNKKYH